MRQRMYDISCLLVSIQDILKLKCNQSKKKFLTAQKKVIRLECVLYIWVYRAVMLSLLIIPRAYIPAV